jgi:two-component system OmpR family response regulator
MSTLPKVIVVDEAADRACLMVAGLRVEGFDVETAPDARGALDLMTGETFEFAVVDMMLPGTNGIELARLMREQFPYTRVILMSAYPVSERLLVLADCGAVGFVPMPFDLTELVCFLRGKLAPVEPAEGGEVVRRWTEPDEQ